MPLPAKKPFGPPTVFMCRICGVYANHGIGVSVRKDKGEWFCRTHFLMRSEGQEQQARFLKELSEIDDESV